METVNHLIFETQNVILDSYLHSKYFMTNKMRQKNIFNLKKSDLGTKEIIVFNTSKKFSFITFAVLLFATQFILFHFWLYLDMNVSFKKLYKK